MDNTIKQRLIIYSIISGISYVYFIFVPYLGIGMTVFALLQLALILYLTKDRIEVKNKKSLLLFIPILVLTSRYFLSDSYTFYLSNFAVIFLLYSTMVLLMMDDLLIENQGLIFIMKILCTVFKPLFYFNIPVKWSIESNKDNQNRILIKKILIGIVISIPCLVIIISLLSAADLVFESKIDVLFNSFGNIISPLTIFKIVFGILVGLYLFGLFYMIFEKKSEGKDEANPETTEKIILKPQGDLVIINVILIAILVIYTLFALIQFKYLFAGAALPSGFTYAEYARRGFFELLFLSFINIGLILIIIYLTKDKIYNSTNKTGNYVKALMLYLCAITVLLLVSSFYRMVLYNNEYGFTELRLLVSIFLVFESIGLLITFYFIIKPRFNIIATYSLICLVFYLTINIINLDYFIAKNNIDMYFDGKDLDYYYLVNLSADAAPQMARLLNSTDDNAKVAANTYFIRIKDRCSEIKDWRSFNLSRERAIKIKNQLVK